MNGTKIASIILMIIVAGISYAVQIVQKNAKASATEAQDAEAEYLMVKQANTLADIGLTALRHNTQELRSFLKEWEPVIARIQTGQDAEQAINSILRNSGIFTISQKFEIKATTSNTLVPKVLQGTVIVQDEYSKTLNWLGDLEKRLPLARINSCSLKQGETGRQINLELQLEIPLINLSAIEGKPKA